MHNFIRRNETAVILHLFYTDLWPEIYGYLRNIQGGYDLYVSMPEGRNLDGEHIVLSDVPDAVIIRLPNRGRDIAPFLYILGQIAPLGYQQICKIHSKKSPHLFRGHKWRNELYKALLGSSDQVNKIISAFEHHHAIGIVGPASYLLNYQDYKAINDAQVDRSLDRMGVGVEKKMLTFFAGSMFWFKPDALAALMELSLNTEDFELENGQIDGTLAHALERVFLAAAATAGFVVITTDELTEAGLVAAISREPFVFPVGKKSQRPRLLRNTLVQRIGIKLLSWFAACRI